MIDLDNESNDVVDVTKPETTPLFLTSPARIGLAIGDEPEDWCGDFHDAVDVTWFEGDAAQAPVSVCIQYVREDLYDFVIGERNNLSTLWGESLRTVADLRAALAERDRMLGEAQEDARCMSIIHEYIMSVGRSLATIHDSHQPAAPDAAVKESLTTQPQSPDVDLWPFLRNVLKRGAAIESQFSQQGYETFVSEIEAAARSEDKKLRAILATLPPSATVEQPVAVPELFKGTTDALSKLSINKKGDSHE